MGYPELNIKYEQKRGLYHSFYICSTVHLAGLLPSCRLYFFPAWMQFPVGATLGWIASNGHN